MNITQFAEQVLFAKTLSEKLTAPDNLVLESSPERQSLVALSSPGRPPGMKMHSSGHKNIAPPSDSQLENEYARGQLLHFLANHELLATELMALVLLKFPNAPLAFQRGVLATLQEEQRHTKMYIRRMQSCGVEFGQHPLSGQFWRLVEPMQSPMDFVSRLSLTFEQANLDYSLHFAKVFQKLGDTKTANVLKTIYQDEIGHVQHGLHWFRQWKDPVQSDWEAYQQALDFPMSAQRGRGPQSTFNREGRLAAGLDQSFIDSIEVFRQSRGRVPTVRWFDPAVESELATLTSSTQLSPKAQDLNRGNKDDLTPNHCLPPAARSPEARLLNQLGKDLELVMTAVAKQDDVVLVRRMPSIIFRKQLISQGIELPEFVPFADTQKLQQRILDNFLPWAWTPANHAIASPFSSVTRKKSAWNPAQAQLFRKSWANRQFIDLLQTPDLERPDFFAGPECGGIPIKQLDELPQALTTIADRGFEQAIFKLDLSASGRGQRRLPCQSPLGKADQSWLQSMWRIQDEPKRDNQQNWAIIEPRLKRLVDLSFLWTVPTHSQAAKFSGWTHAMVSAGRRYQGTFLGNAFTGCEQRVKRFLLSDQYQRLHQTADWLSHHVIPAIAEISLPPALGIDAFVYETDQGKLAIKPIVELNPRMTMGHIALNLQRKLAPGVPAQFRIFTRPEWEKHHEPLQAIKFSMTSDGHWKSGTIWLGEVTPSTKLVPTVIIGREALNIFNAK